MTVLVLFGVAMTEVGNSLVPRDRVEVFNQNHGFGGYMQVVNRGERFFACDEFLTQIATFRVDQDGRIRDLRRAGLPYDRGAGTFPEQNRIIGLAIDDQGRLVATGRKSRIDPDARGRNRMKLLGLWRTTLAWPEGDKPQVVSETIMIPPAASQPVNPKNNEVWSTEAPQALQPAGPEPVNFRYIDGAGSGRFLYLLCGIPSATNAQQYILYVYEGAEGPRANPRYEIVLPIQSGGFVRQVYFGRGELVTQQFPSNRYQGYQSLDSAELWLATFDPDHPETLGDKKRWSVRPSASYDVWHGYQPFGEFGSADVMWTKRGELAFLSTRRGLRIMRQVQPQHWEPIGECGASPLAIVVGSWGNNLGLVDETLLMECGASAIIAYDVSDPSRPRRLGFFNTRAAINFWENQVFATQRHIVLCENNWVTVLERPR